MGLGLSLRGRCRFRSRYLLGPNEKKMSDGGRERASIGVELWKSSQKWSVERSAVRSIAWLDLYRAVMSCAQAKTQIEPTTTTKISPTRHSADRTRLASDECRMICKPRRLRRWPQQVQRRSSTRIFD